MDFFISADLKHVATCYISYPGPDLMQYLKKYNRSDK